MLQSAPFPKQESMDRALAVLGSGLAFLAVLAGAFGAHALGAAFQAYPQSRTTFDTAAQYHLLHALAILFAAWAAARWPGSLAPAAGAAFAAGILLFSGSLYLLSLTRARAWGMITPLGGLAFLAGWALLGLAALRGGR